MFLYKTLYRDSRMLEIKEKRLIYAKGLQAKYLFAFLIAKNKVNNKQNSRLCAKNPLVKKKGLYYDEEKKQYLAFDFTKLKLRYQYTHTEREALIFLRNEEDLDY